MYAKLALKNAKRSISDYLIYIITLIILSALIFTSNILAFGNSLNAIGSAHTLPLLITLIMAILMSYINSFMVKKRTKELAIYAVLGMEEKTVINLFFVESLLIGIICLFLGIILGFIVFYFIIKIVLTMNIVIINMNIATLLKAFASSILYFILTQFIVLFLSRRRLRKLKIYDLIYGGRKNEIIKDSKVYTFIFALFVISMFITAYLIYNICSHFVSLNLKMMSVSMISIPIIIAVYSFYISAYNIIGLLRKKRPELFYKKSYTFLAGQILSKVKTNSILTSAMSLCIIVSAISCIFGMVVLNSSNMIFDSETSFLMGFYQVYICIMFMVIVFTILSLQQIVDSKENKYRYSVLNKLGTGSKPINKLIIKQVGISFTSPLIMFFIIMSLCIIPLNFMLNDIFVTKNLILNGFAMFALILSLVYVAYFFITYKYVKIFIQK